MICFCLGNEVISIVTSHVDGLSCIFYLSFGAWITGVAYQIIMTCVNARNPDTEYSWHPNNIIVGGKMRVTHLLLFVIMCGLFFGIMSSMFMTMYFSHISGVNVGVITTIWSVQPLIAAIIDWIVYRRVLGFNHLVGIVLVVIGAVLIGLAGISKGGEQANSSRLLKNFIPPVPKDGIATYHPEIRDEVRGGWYTWIALLWGFITPCFFLSQSFYTKFIT